MDALTNDITKVHAAVKSELRKVLGNLEELNKSQVKDTEKKLGLPPLIPAPRNARHDSLRNENGRTKTHSSGKIRIRM